MPDSTIKVKIGICPNRDVELHDALAQVPLRRRAERLRALALAGLRSAPNNGNTTVEAVFSVTNGADIATQKPKPAEDDRRSALMSLMRNQLSSEST